jgi:hypothetical protein
MVMPSKPKSKNLIRNCQFAFKCDAVWEELEKGRSSKIRFCSQCKTQIYFCNSDDDLRKNVIKNRCVAIEKTNHVGEVRLVLGSVNLEPSAK